MEKMMPQNLSVALIGMPAVGKSTVGVLLAKQLGYDFLDTDILIQTKENMTLAQIIGKKGVQGFLDIEAGHLLGLGGKRRVISTGGSVIYREQAMRHLKKIATVIYLHADLSTLLTRLSDLEARGVAIDPNSNIDALYKERTPLYDKFCDIKIACGQKLPGQVAADIAVALRDY
ncbi:shikimate kinase [Desulfobacter vibrioformis]|uniref:shikimate kinase n=1 Tax=Desulfobacter vibrioformis TaxID=34031 RepID=UPI001FE2146D|nr:shikimate kinase [Desulfobacter vibrioformis]